MCIQYSHLEFGKVRRMEDGHRFLWVDAAVRVSNVANRGTPGRSGVTATLRFELRAGVGFHLAGPVDEAGEVAAFAPREGPKFEESDLLHFDAGVGFHAPEQIGAAPRGQVMALGRAPEEA